MPSAVYVSPSLAEILYMLKNNLCTKNVEVSVPAVTKLHSLGVCKVVGTEDGLRAMPAMSAIIRV
jgi:hypothetical protein